MIGSVLDVTDLDISRFSLQTSNSSIGCPPLVYRSQKHSRLMLEQMNELRSESCLCDVTLVIGSTRINAHRLVLASCSNYFRAMFTSEMAESRQRLLSNFC